MSEVYSKLEVLSRGRCVPQASTNESQAQPGRCEQHASTNESQVQPLVLIVDANDFSALEERIVRTVEMVKWERQGRMAAEERALQAEAALNEHAQRIDALERELHALNSDRDHAHLRIERLLNALRDALELSGSAEPGRQPVTSILDRPATGEGASGKSSSAAG